MALRRDGTVSVWGENDEDFNVLGVPASVTNVVAIAAGTYHALALRADGTVVAWGAPGVADVPPDLHRVVAIAAGGYHNQVLIQNQEVLSWPRVEGGRFRAEINLPAGTRYRLESAGQDGRWLPGASGVAHPGNLTVDVPITGTESRLFRAVPLGR
jgi:alpha-tubulin suppressor-like RCC1 family protein